MRTRKSRTRTLSSSTCHREFVVPVQSFCVSESVCLSVCVCLVVVVVVVIVIITVVLVLVLVVRMVKAVCTA